MSRTASEAHLSTEENQAEFMVAETLVYLGNPSVLDVRWYILQDLPWDTVELTA